MSDAHDEVLAMQGRTERANSTIPLTASSALASAAALFRKIETPPPLPPAEEWIVGDAGAFGIGAYGHLPAAAPAASVAPELLARRELAARLDGGMAEDTAS
ncbi:hypothetical protein D9623_23770 [Azospirillum brasilense]|uniref:Uncharacterized protein n=1 Tax=Azospirillum brasilense TaxID=192 RepID=A0A0P0FCE2_AZOBR|nr:MULTISPECIES: hypothetical protein [Azospirillum]ALJ38632.1 hypothetical protein AMK58_24530 [Azospirillum brasilense]MDW7553308.1 hypothetical protein [Azospirillum brasilense]MDW7593313.1 hypothetical protein [Azospirillum brasilense]MDW7628627.1 hypothetical protein [Azospirillum brasilense]MDX5955278.1 hypothetical protein [Azospirillum brasilense]